MKRLTFIVIFVGTNILFVFLQIHKEGLITKTSYALQTIKTKLTSLTQQKEALIHQLQALQNPSAVKKFAMQELNMKPVKLSQIKLMADNDHHE